MLTLTSTAIGTTGGAGELGVNEPGPVLRIAYRNRFLRALRILRRQGKITRQEHSRFAWASFNEDFISGFVTEVQGAAKAAGDWVENIREWFKMLTDWIVENWPTILRIVLSLLVFI